MCISVLKWMEERPTTVMCGGWQLNYAGKCCVTSNGPLTFCRRSLERKSYEYVVERWYQREGPAMLCARYPQVSTTGFGRIIEENRRIPLMMNKPSKPPWFKGISCKCKVSQSLCMCHSINAMLYWLCMFGQKSKMWKREHCQFNQ